MTRSMRHWFRPPRLDPPQLPRREGNAAPGLFNVMKAPAVRVSKYRKG
jgi:hypothetical protein